MEEANDVIRRYFIYLLLPNKPVASQTQTRVEKALNQCGFVYYITYGGGNKVGLLFTESITGTGEEKKNEWRFNGLKGIMNFVRMWKETGI